MACGKKSNNAPTEDFILASPAPVDVAAKISAVFRELSFKVRLSFSQLNGFFHPRGQIWTYFGTFWKFMPQLETLLLEGFFHMDSNIFTLYSICTT